MSLPAPGLLLPPPARGVYHNGDCGNARETVYKASSGDRHFYQLRIDRDQRIDKGAPEPRRLPDTITVGPGRFAARLAILRAGRETIDRVLQL